jgi:AcrR family transcriptional regulator
MSTTKPVADQPSARARLLSAANELFYEEGVRSVGIDRVIEQAGVAKATLYKSFGSKDELIRAYLDGRAATRREAITRELAKIDSPRERLLGIFDVLGKTFLVPGFHGCAFVNASAEALPGSTVEQASDEYRTWIRALFVELATAAGAQEPETLARQLHLLYDGAGISARMDRDPSAAAAAREAATVLVDAATSRKRSRRSPLSH